MNHTPLFCNIQFAQSPEWRGRNSDSYFLESVSNGIMAGVANFYGVDQTTPLGTPNGAADNTTTPSVTLSTQR